MYHPVKTNFRAEKTFVDILPVFSEVQKLLNSSIYPVAHSNFVLVQEAILVL